MSKKKHTIRGIKGEVLLQFGMILWFLNLFVITAFISSSTQKTSIKWMVFDTTVLTLADLLWFILWKKSPEKPAIGKMLAPKSILDKIRSNWQITLVLVVSFLQRFWMIGNLQRWDAGEYYYRLGTACKEWEFSIFSFFKKFRLCLHPTYGLALITAPGEFLDPRGAVGVFVISLFFTLVATWCLYILFKDFYGKMTKGKAAFSAFFCMSLPLIWGTFDYFNPDYFIAIFMILFIYAESQEHYVSMFFWGFCVSQCKETGIIIVFGYALARVIAIAIHTKGWIGKKVKAEWNNKGNWSALAVGLSYVAYAVMVGGLSTWKTSNSEEVTSFSWNNEGFNCFGFNVRYIYEKICQLFILNYSWILWMSLGIMVVFLIVRGIGRKKRKCDIDFVNLSGLLGGGFIYAMFSFFYITYTIYRYHEFWILGTGMLFCIFFFECTKKWKMPMYAIPVVLLSVLLGVETFKTTDPIGKKLVRTIDTGKQTMLFSSGGAWYFGDYLVYNYQYTWLDKAFDELLREVGYDEHTMIITTQEQEWATQFEGNGTFFVTRWDPKKQERTQKEEDTDHITVLRTRVISDDRVYEQAVLNEEGILKDKGILYFIPYYEENEAEYLEMMNTYYEIGERREIEDTNGRIAYYQMVLRQKYGGSAEDLPE